MFCQGLYYSFFKKKLPRRDFDIVLIGDKVTFIKNLRKAGFAYGRIIRKNQVVMHKKLVKHPKTLSDYVTIDIDFRRKADIGDFLKRKINFTVNCLALSLDGMFDKSWKSRLVHPIPTTIRDIKSKKLILNKYASEVHGTDMFACMRFMSLGFKQPAKEEIRKLYTAMRTLPKYKFERNRKKVFDYVGGEANARHLARKLGIKEDIFDFNTIEKMRRRKKYSC